MWVVVTLTFGLLRTLPGGPFDQERQLPPAIAANLNAQYHLDKPLWEQYGRYLQQLCQANLGPSYKYPSRSVNQIVAEAFWPSLGLGALSILIGLTAGVGVAVGRVLWQQRQQVDSPSGKTALLALPWAWQGVHAIAVASPGLMTLALSVPGFLVAGVLVVVFSLGLRWLPAALLTSPAHWVLPSLALSVTPFALSAVVLSNSLEAASRTRFLHMKHISGLPLSTVVLKHALRYGVLPLVAMAGPLVAGQITGSFVIENIFAIPGLGKHFVMAVSNRDYTLVMGVTVLFAVLLIGFNMLSELAYGWLDPRVRR